MVTLPTNDDAFSVDGGRQVGANVNRSCFDLFHLGNRTNRELGHGLARDGVANTFSFATETVSLLGTLFAGTATLPSDTALAINGAGGFMVLCIASVFCILADRSLRCI